LGRQSLDSPLNVKPQTKAAADKVDTPAADELYRVVLEPHEHNAPQGEDTLRFTLACKLRDLGADETTALNLMRLWNMSCDYPREDSALTKAVRNAYRYGKNPPGSGGLWEQPPPPPEEAFETLAQAEAESPTPPPRPHAGLRLKSAGELMDAPPPEWLVRDWLPALGLSVIYGPPKSGKTFAALDLAHAIATGRDRWLGDHGLELNPKFRERPVLLLALEAPETLGPRLRALAIRYDGTETATRERILWLGREAADFNVITRDLPLLLKQEGIEPAAVIVDTYARLMIMNRAEENNTLDQGRAAEVLERLGETLGCAVIVVAHTGKDAERGIRGSNALLAAASAAIEIAPDPERRGVNTMRVSEQRSGPSGQQIAVGCGCPVAIDADGDTLVPVWEALAEDAAAATAAPSATVEAVREAVQQAAASALRSGSAPEISLASLHQIAISCLPAANRNPPKRADVLRALRLLLGRWPPGAVSFAADSQRVFLQPEMILHHEETADRIPARTASG